MITPMQIYWILKLDDIHMAFGFMFFTGLLLMIVCGFGTLIFSDGYSSKIAKCFRNIVTWVGVPLAVIGGLASTFIPTTKQMTAIHVVPAIANNERVQNIGNKTLDISEDLLKLAEQHLQAVLVDKN